MNDLNNISDKDFDDLFKTSAENSMPEFEESAWDKMESLLDDSDSDNGGFVSKKPIIYGAIILMLFSVAYLTFVAINKRGNELNFNSKSEDGVSTPNEINSGKLNKLEAVRDFKDRRYSSETIIEKKGDGNKETVLAGSNSGQNVALSSTSKSKFSTNNSVKDLLLFEDRLSDQKKNKTYFNQTNDSSLNNKESEEIENNDFINGNENLIVDIKQRESNIKDLVLLELKPHSFHFYQGIINDISIKAPLKIANDIETKDFSKWNLRLGISPDFSAVPKNKFFKIGHNWSAVVEYRMNSKWSVQTGVIQSLKYYVADPEQYLWPDRWGAKPNQLNRIDAKCNMLDIPINIRYNFSNGQNQWFLQSGLTSYLMLNEKYDYVYASNYINQTWESWEGKTGFYAAAVANFSFGVERKIGKRLTLQAEPFFKIPLGNIGFGDVKLITTGLFISSKIELAK